MKALLKIWKWVSGAKVEAVSFSDADLDRAVAHPTMPTPKLPPKGDSQFHGVKITLPLPGEPKEPNP